MARAGDAQAGLQFGGVRGGGHKDRLHVAKERVTQAQGGQTWRRYRASAEAHHRHRLADDRGGQVVDAGLYDQAGYAQIGDQHEGEKRRSDPPFHPGLVEPDEHIDRAND